MNKTETTKNLSYKIRLIFYTPFWFLSTSPDRKTWAEFKSGLIKHECKFDYENPKFDKFKYYKCKHFGCNIISTKNEDGSWTWQRDIL